MKHENIKQDLLTSITIQWMILKSIINNIDKFRYMCSYLFNYNIYYCMLNKFYVQYTSQSEHKS